MSFWKNLFGISKTANGSEKSQRDTQLMEEPEHELAKMPPDDLMVTKQEEKHKTPDQMTDRDHNIKDKQDAFDNKSSP